ncbi:MAG: putative bifunctional diguanylate cyclase/phosphodiesterase [Gaiellaceae bacterium]
MRLPNRRSLRARLQLALAAMFVPLLLVGGTSVFFLHQESTGSAQRERALAEEIVALTRLDRLLFQAEELASGAAAASPDRESIERFRSVSRKVDAEFAVLGELGRGRQSTLIALASSHWRRAQADALGAFRPRREADDSSLAAARFALEASSLQRRLEAIADGSFAEFKDDAAAALRQERDQVLILLFTVALGAGIALVAARRLSMSIVSPLGRLEEAAGRLGADDLSVRVPVEQADELGRVAGSFNTMAERLEASRDELTHQAFHDSLTGLPNRALCADRAAHALARSADGEESVAVLFIDLDDFKVVNDSLGHSYGDELLVSVARRLEGALRPADTLARLGGDEFAVLLEDVRLESDALRTASRILAALQEPFRLPGNEFFVSASIGISLASAGDDQAIDLLRNADLAMYSAKLRGKGCSEIFQERMHEKVRGRLRLEADLRIAIDQEQLVLHYQPVVDLAGGEIVGVEALVRWQHPTRGLLPPAEFIDVAEKTGLIEPLGLWVLERACREGAELRRLLAPGSRLSIGVNLSPRQFQHPNLLADVAAALTTSGLDPDALLLEITESVLMREVEEGIWTLRALKGLGVRLALDDFGTGYSSLSYLRRFPIDIAKIDKAFVGNVATDRKEAEFMRAIVELGKTLGVRTLAEGIEQAEQVAALREFGCDLGQGFVFARPLALPALIELLTSGATSRIAA